MGGVAVNPGSAAPRTVSPVRGHIDRVDPAGIVRGWCAASTPPFGARRVIILVDDEIVLRAVTCDKFRNDLKKAGIGDGNHGFLAMLPDAVRARAPEARVSIIDEASGVQIGHQVHVRWAPVAAADEKAASPAKAAAPVAPKTPALITAKAASVAGETQPMPAATQQPAAAPPMRAIQAHIDQVSSEGMVTGWAWDPAAPERSVTLNVLVDGERVLTTRAGIYRDDLRTAGKGTGQCGFSFFLPWENIAGRAEIALSLQDDATGLPAGPSLAVQRPHVSTADQRIDALERQLQLLRAELRAAEARARQAEDHQAAPELFRLVAGFFQDLADGKPRPGLVSLKARLDETAARLSLVPLTWARAPACTILVLADAGLDNLHACLAALHRAGADLRARIAVLDLGGAEAETVALIHAVVRNLTVLRLRPDETLNDILLNQTTPAIALLPSHVHAHPEWLERLLAVLDADAAVGVAGAALAGADKLPVTRKLIAEPGIGLRLVASTETGEAAAAAADGIDEFALVLRTATLRRLQGLDLSFSGLGSQMLDYCLRVRAAGMRVHYLTQALAELSYEVPSPLDQCAPNDLARLRHAALGLAAKRPPEAAAARGKQGRAGGG